MDLIISNSSNRPIYEQITTQIKELILTGELQPGQKLPSIRALANGLRISVITTKRAYTDLEAQGFIETVQGKGSFVTGGNVELLREERRRQIEQRLMRLVDDARSADIGDDELREMMDLIMEGDAS
ncbi:GntR family transcriptional regulator [Bifidobacterium pullorum]|uniref:GntR family transcriptional regulator n=1 Tax=Bifidobacterium pullorum TaxID=78448 RepID=UPI00242FCFB7|nr:GntR family transcriptional regulator [Bifidobacterium pullorum]